MTLAYKVSLISLRCCSERRQQQQMLPPWIFQALPSLRWRIYSVCAPLWSHGIKIGGEQTGPRAEQAGAYGWVSCPTAPHAASAEGAARGDKTVAVWLVMWAGGSSSLAAAGKCKAQGSASAVCALIKKQWGSRPQSIGGDTQVIRWEWSPGGQGALFGAHTSESSTQTHTLFLLNVASLHTDNSRPESFEGPGWRKSRLLGNQMRWSRLRHFSWLRLRRYLLLANTGIVFIASS